jgi:multidrug resistance efflux pump
MKIQLCVIVSLSCLVGEVWAQANEDASIPAAVVVVEPITTKTALEGRAFVGSVVPSRRSVVGSAVDGRVIKVAVEDGTPVTGPPNDETSSVGEPLVQLRTTTISIEIAAARAEFDLRSAELTAAENGSRPEEIAQAEARLKAAAAIMRFAKTRFERVKMLRATSTASQEEFEELQSLFLAAEQRQIEAQAGYKLTAIGPRPEVKEQLRARKQAALEEVNRLEDMRKKYTIRAPFNGFVTAKLTEVGAWVSRGDPVVEIVHLDQVDIRVAVPETYITHVHIGNRALVRLESTSETVIVGKVTRIVPLADRRSRTFPVIIRLDNPATNGNHLMKAGMLAHVTIGVGQEKSVLTVPKDALVLDGKSCSIMVIEKNVARAVAVQLGVAIDSSIQVVDPTNSLREGQFVVTRGNERLRDQQPVKIVEFERNTSP